MPFRAIRPKKDPFKFATTTLAMKLAVTMRNFGVSAQSRLSNYPPSQSDYVRTGQLGRRWTMEGPKRRGKGLFVRVGNKTEYGIWVQGPTEGDGPKQVGLMATYGWLSVTTVKKDLWDRVYRPRLIAMLEGKL